MAKKGNLIFYLKEIWRPIQRDYGISIEEKMLIFIYQKVFIKRKIIAIFHSVYLYKKRRRID